MTDTGKILRRVFYAAVLAFLLAAVIAPDRGDMLSGLGRIVMSPAQLTKDYFLIGGISGTFLNMALVAALCAGLTSLPGAVVKGSTFAAFFLTVGFTTWGINIMNIWPFLAGVALNCMVRRLPLASGVDLAMFSTGLCPLVSELLLRYPNETDVHAVTAGSVLLAVGIGVLIGFLTPAIAGHSPNVHKGFDLYSAALPAGMLGFFLTATLYKTAGYTVPAIAASLGESRPAVVWTFHGLFFTGCIVAGYLLNGKSFKGYGALLKDSGHKADFTAKYGPGLAIMNFGIYGLFLIGYYIAVNAAMGDPFAGFNGVTMGLIYCMSCFAAAGSHPANVWPIMVGYVLASLVGVTPINAQGIMVGLCYASGLCPIVGVYGWWAGIIGGAAHYCLVTSVPALHGGFCLYNGGFTAVLIAILLVPQLEMFCKSKAEKA